MGNSLLEIKPHEVSRDLSGYSVLFYGAPKSGKTTIASKFPGALILAFEKGFNTLPGVMVKPLNTWGEFKKVLVELKDPEVKKIFKTIVIDTCDLAYGYCEKYICDMNDKDSIGEIPYGKGYSLCQTEFDECIRKVLQMNYGLVLISHSQDKTFTDEDGNEYNQIVPTLDKRARLICERTCDIIGYSKPVKVGDKTVTRLYLRETPRFVAGSRFKYMPDYIDFNYQNLVDAINEAIDKEAAENDNQYVTDEKQNYHVEKVYNFKELMNEFQTIVGEFMSSARAAEYSPKITEIVEKYLGKGKKVSECTSAQVQQLDMIVYDLKNLL